ncbi:AgrD family cyclic lactone autoinducer peptide [Paenibacillus caseinilyticus]|nr:cyclic lactone autoinducer peptide [Paenibacillus mucilaginosus]
MKKRAAILASAILTIIASFFAFTNSYVYNRPETPEELLKK